MPSSNSSDAKSIPPTHEDFHWIHGPGRENVLADFVELAHDISAGISSCLQIIYTSDLTREINLDADPGEEAAPSVGRTDAANLFRLSMVAATLLCRASEERIAWLNTAREE
jgi:hypothetical protein